MQSLLATLSALKVKIEVRDGKLHVNAPAGALTPELHQAIGRHKEELIERLQGSRVPELEDELPQIVPDPQRRHEPFPLNDVQHAYWVGRNAQLELGQVSSHVYFEFECGDLDADRLTAAFQKVVALHGMMHAVIDVNGQQRILETVPAYEIAVCDLRDADPDRREAELQQVRSELSQQVFSCDQWPLFEIRLIKIAEDHSRLCVSWDFLVVDAWSMLIIFRQWYGFYQNPAYQASAPVLSFRDYVLAEARLKELPAFQTSKKYWWDRIDELPSAPLLPVVSKIERGRKYEFNRRRMRLPARQWEEIKARGRRAGLTPSSVLLAAFSEVLNRWARSSHYCLNLTLFNRLPMHEEVESIVGDFTNLMVLEVDGREGGRFIDRASRIQVQFLGDFEHRRVNAVEVLRELAKRRGWQQRAILPVVFTSTLMLDGKRSEDAGGWERFGSLGYGIGQTPQVWLDYQIFEVNGDLVINWDAVDDVFLPGVLDAMFDTHRELLESLATVPEVWERPEGGALPRAQQKMRESVNDTAAEEMDKCLHELFIAKALESPDRIALASSAGEMRYGELLAHSHLVAEQLLERGVQPNQLVAIVMQKGWEQIVAALGVLMAGAAYLPIDPRWPALRRNELLERGEARIALTQNALGKELEWPTDIERIPVIARNGLARLTAAPATRQATKDLAYVIFTSGSTGTPKGVMIDHRGAVNTVVHVNRVFGVGEDDRVLAVSSLTFDLSVYDIFGLLAVGGTVVIPDANLSRDASHWEDLIKRKNVTIWNSAPPLMGVLADAMEGVGRSLPSLRLVLLSGDWIPVQLPDRIRRLSRSALVVSLGGATEGSIWSIYHPVAEVSPDWDSIPYGKALPNQHMYVLNENLEPCPDLVTGNIYIGGLGVALGYWKDPEKTNKQFIQHPKSGERLYFTGDLGRFQRDGNIEFLGREDSQIKLRGYRVELGEISACIQSHPDVREAVVRLAKEEGRSSLTAYVVADAVEGSRLFERTEASGQKLQQLSTLVAEAGRNQEREADRGVLETFWDFWKQIEKVCLCAMLETLLDLGIVDGSDASEHLGNLVKSGRVKAQYRRLIEHWLKALAGSGHLNARGGCYQVSEAGLAGAGTAEQQLIALEKAHCHDDRLSGFLEYVALCLRHHLQLLGGEVSPLELLFPEGSRHVVEALYGRNPIASYHNRVMAALVSSLVSSWEGDRRLRALEIGAGTGNTSSFVLPALPAARTEYWYTDVSSYFLNAAKEKFKEYSFLRYATFDIDKDGKSQGHQPHSYDLIIASNVLHNAADINASLGYIRDLLRPGGYLLILEGTRSTPWLWASAAFLELVSAYSDDRAESDEPTLSAEGWSRALGRGRYEEVQIFPALTAADGGEPSEALEAMPQHVIATQGPASVSRFRAEELAAFVHERLPDYMAPQRYVLLERFPLTANGKVDLGALPSEISSQTTGERRVVSPKSGNEERILKVWKEVLGIEQLSITDNFFEVGGDSLLMTEVLRKINQWGQSPLTIAELFSYPTVQSLANYISPVAKVQEVRPAANLGHAERGPRRPTGDIAIIGRAGRFPDARNVDELWQNLSAGKCSVRNFTDEELLQAGVSHEELAQENYVRAGTVLEGMDLFDASFFGFTPREAEIMDPQQRFLLECAVEALENAGYASEKYTGKIGVFAGKGTSLYLLEHLVHRPELFQKLGIMPIVNLNEKDHATTLVSYKLNLTGPSVNINTTCSTSLVAVHSACQSLLNEECEIALAGGVSFVSTLKRSGYLYYDGHILSREGLCRAFSDDADGSIFGNGVGLVVLKPLAAALRDGDMIHAVIKGSAINNDGSLKVGYTAPNLHGQADVIARAQAMGGVSPDSIQLLEAHGTGTHLGDPIEFGALRKVFGGPRPDGSRCALGSVKTNIGHLDAAAGVAGLIKVVEALKHKKIPATLHAAVPNRKIDFTDSPFYLGAELADWQAGTEPRRAGVSSFGVGGTNAHIVVEEAPPVAERRTVGGAQLLPLSAKSNRSLRQMTQELAVELGRRPDLSLEDVAFTLQVGRNAYKYRSFLVCDSLGDARRELEEGSRLRIAEQNEGQTPSVAFLFPGQGAQQRGLTSELYETQPAFRSALDQCAEIVQQYTEENIIDYLYAKRHDDALGDLDIDQTIITQPLLFAVEYALARFWESLGIRPTAMLGHSLGEYVAACIAGVFSLEEVLSLIVVRGQLLQSLEPGRMLAVSCGEAQLRDLLEESACSLAAVNGQMQCVVSGANSDIEILQGRLEAAEISSRVLRTSHAFHSAMVEPILDTYEQCVAEVKRNRPAIPFISNVSGTWITEEQATSPSYWARHMRETVRFGDGAQELLELGSCIMLEVGPGHSLSTLVNRRAGASLERAVPTLGYDRSLPGERQAVLDAIGRLWLHGIDIDWARLHKDAQPKRVPLPSYAFDRKRFWIERGPGLGRMAAAAAASTGGEIGTEAPAKDEPLEVLAAYARPELQTTYVAPGNEIEAKLVEIWQCYLGIENIGVRDNFFELGGDSLLATRVYAQIKKELDVELPAGKMFEFATIRHMYLFIATSNNQTAIDALSEEELDEFLALMES
ncbi:MAG TPA: amino acid adenylation domain-containing protein [Thermoanaerobaculia bacterium]|jgi:amino acid adenylation domain-containing protein|nr:amino acid adenylation domain-containing protein [Thermoanaerobaculia bacterium]